MPRTPTRPTVAPFPMPHPEPTSSAVWLIGWGIYVLLVLLGFGFGVWAGNQKQKPTETAHADSPTLTSQPPASPASSTTPPTTPPQKRESPGPVTQEPPKKVTETKPPAPPPTPEPKKPPTPEPKKPPTPEPKKTEPTTPSVKQVSFTTEVLPIFRSKCLNCHGAVGKPKGGLDLRTIASIMKGGDGGAEIKPGDLKSSPLWTSIDEGAMPPAGKEQLTDAEKMIVRNWILSGAK